jgi:phosphosulfolactate synthase
MSPCIIGTDGARIIIVPRRHAAFGRRSIQQTGEGIASMATAKEQAASLSTTQRFLEAIGVANITPRTSPFDPGYDPATVESHLEQSAHLISVLKISMACWQVASEAATRRKIQAAHKYGVATSAGGGPFEVAAYFRKLPEYLDLCAGLGFTRIEAGAGFTDLAYKPSEVVRMAEQRGLQVQFEVGKKHGGTFSDDMVGELIEQGREWLDAGATQIVVEARESASDVGLFGAQGQFNAKAAERFAEGLGFERTVFEAPNKPSQFAILNHFGPQVYMTNVRLEELLRVEIYRRGLHSDAFRVEKLRPKGPPAPR